MPELKYTFPMSLPADFSLSSYTYDLPEEQIAQHPADKRGASRLFVINRETGENQAVMFGDLADYLPQGALLVANNSKVLPARLYGQRPSGGKVEFLMLTPLPLVEIATDADGFCTADVEGLLRMSKRVKVGTEVFFGDGVDHTSGAVAGEAFGQVSNEVSDEVDDEVDDGTCGKRCDDASPTVHTLALTVLDVQEFGRVVARLRWRGGGDALKAFFLSQGHLPLPPYIKRNDAAADKDRYQTVYAREEQLGSVAAPTAGLHFTDELRAELVNRGFEWAEVTLYVGYGTFSPVRADDIREHSMHKEFIEISSDVAARIAQAKAEGRPVVTVGTTSTRVLEGAFAATGEIVAYRGWTDIFIYPGIEFNVADHMITNFHLPESSLLMMVSAFAGREHVLNAYREAITSEFRVFSYGDSMLIL